MSFGINALLKAFNTLQAQLDNFIQNQKSKEEAQQKHLESIQQDLKLAQKLKSKVDDLVQG